MSEQQRTANTALALLLASALTAAMVGAAWQDHRAEQLETTLEQYERVRQDQHGGRFPLDEYLRSSINLHNEYLTQPPIGCWVNDDGSATCQDDTGGWHFDVSPW